MHVHVQEEQRQMVAIYTHCTEQKDYSYSYIYGAEKNKELITSGGLNARDGL